MFAVLHEEVNAPPRPAESAVAVGKRPRASEVMLEAANCRIKSLQIIHALRIHCVSIQRLGSCLLAVFDVRDAGPGLSKRRVTAQISTRFGPHRLETREVLLVSDFPQSAVRTPTLHGLLAAPRIVHLITQLEGVR